METSMTEHRNRDSAERSNVREACAHGDRTVRSRSPHGGLTESSLNPRTTTCGRHADKVRTTLGALPGDHSPHEPWGFQERLAASTTAEGDERVSEILMGYFGAPPDFSLTFAPRETPFSHDCEVVAWGESFTFEDKRRSRDYGDELLEDVSSTASGRAGWTWRAGEADYVLHLYPQRWEILPGPALEQAWRTNRDDWVAAYGHKRARNRRYDTLSVPVPTSTLRAALAEAGAPPCPHCGRPVGRFRSVCNGCGVASCCAVSDGHWACASCVESQA